MTGKQIESQCDTEALYTLAASNGKQTGIMISNLTGETQPLTVEGIDLTNAHIYELGDAGKLAWTPNADSIAPNTVLLIEA